MDAIHFCGLHSVALCQLVQVLRLVLVVEVYGKERHHVDLRTHALRGVVHKRLDVDGFRHLGLDKSGFFGVHVAAQLPNKLFLFCIVKLAIGFRGLDHGAQHQASGGFLILRGFDEGLRRLVEGRVQHLAETCVLLLRTLAHGPGKAAQGAACTGRTGKPAKHACKSATLRSASAELFKHTAQTARTCGTTGAAQKASEHFLHAGAGAVCAAERASRAGCTSAVCQTAKKAAQTTARCSAALPIHHGARAFGHCNADRHFGECFHQAHGKSPEIERSRNLCTIRLWLDGEFCACVDICRRWPLGRTMERKAAIDTFGAVALTLFALHLGFNQVVIKVTNGGFQPVFFAGLRSLGAACVVLVFLRLQGLQMGWTRASVFGGVLSGALFSIEFICLFIALDVTTVSRASIIFYSMPIWLALAAHFALPAEKLSGLRVLGLLLAMGGVVLAVADRGGAPSVLGDVLALVAAMGWAGIALTVRLTGLGAVPPAGQLLWQLVVSAPFLLLVAPLFGPLLREIEPVHLWGLGFQIVAVASLGFLAWFWLLSIYPASGVASFSFLSPVFAVLLGWLILGEEVRLSIWAALGLVALGIWLINRR